MRQCDVLLLVSPVVVADGGDGDDDDGGADGHVTVGNDHVEFMREINWLTPHSNIAADVDAAQANARTADVTVFDYGRASGPAVPTGDSAFASGDGYGSKRGKAGGKGGKPGKAGGAFGGNPYVLSSSGGGDGGGDDDLLGRSKGGGKGAGGGGGAGRGGGSAAARTNSAVAGDVRVGRGGAISGLERSSMMMQPRR